jgi:predicted MFS family arabinose efflux permease
MLRDSHFSYLTYTILTIASQFTTYFMMASWGRHADAYGNIRIVRLTSRFLPLLPLLWCVSHNLIYLFIVQLFSGFIWAGYNLCMTNYVFDTVPARSRVRAASNYNMVNGFGIFLGAMIGSQLYYHMPIVLGYSFHFLIVISAAMRLVTAEYFGPRLQEIRHVQDVSEKNLVLSVVGLKRLPGLEKKPAHMMIRPQPGV